MAGRCDRHGDAHAVAARPYSDRVAGGTCYPAGRYSGTGDSAPDEMRQKHSNQATIRYFRHMSPEEEKTWRSIQAKDKQVFERYYKEHYKFFFLVACRYLGDAAPAKEVVNDVYLRLWQDAE